MYICSLLSRRRGWRSSSSPGSGGSSLWALLSSVPVSGEGLVLIKGSVIQCRLVKRSWYLVLEKIVKVPGTKGALTKMVLDQGIIVNRKRPA